MSIAVEVVDVNSCRGGACQSIEKRSGYLHLF